MKNVSKLGEISVTQRTALGNDQSSQTNVYIVKNVESSNGDVKLCGGSDAKQYRNHCGSEIVGFYAIIHPEILAGTWEENFADFCRITERKLTSDGLIKANDWGINFWMEKEVTA